MSERVRSIDPKTALGFSTSEVPQFFFESWGQALQDVYQDVLYKQVSQLLEVFPDADLGSDYIHQRLTPNAKLKLPLSITSFLKAESEQLLMGEMGYSFLKAESEQLLMGEMGYCQQFFEITLSDIDSQETLRKVSLFYSPDRSREKRRLTGIALIETGKAQNGDVASRVVKAAVSGSKLVRIHDFRRVERTMGIRTILDGMSFLRRESDEIAYEWRDGFSPRTILAQNTEFVERDGEKFELTSVSVGKIYGLSFEDFRRMPGINEEKRMRFPINHLRESFPPDLSLYPQ